MKLRKLSALALAATFAAGAAFAGEGHKCSASTQECLDYLATKMKDSGWVGVELDGSEGSSYMTITKVVPDSPAEGAGLQPGDVLVAINGIEISEENQKKLMKARASWKPGDSVTWSMKRGGSDRDFALTLAPMPADVLAAYIGAHMLEHAQLELAAAEE